VSGASGGSLEEAARAKQAVRERVWGLLERERAARFPGAKGRIPNFAGAAATAARLASLPAWRAARVLKANPDAPQLAVRARALAEDKLVYMAVPRLADERPFILLDPRRLDVPPRRAASISGATSGATRAGRRIGVAELQPVDLVVCGSVAVNRQGARVGKGGGFSDLEFALLVEAGLIGKDTVLATTAHPLQVLAEALPETPARLPPGPDRRRRGGHHLPPYPAAARHPVGAPRRCQDRRHPRPVRLGTAARKVQAVMRRSAIVELARVRG
jgi:5-formyltetrahydrofolate cyclo-ligase